jgi:molybdate transport system regulatory protein
LVERQRGGSGGGGSQLTETASELLSRYDRRAAAVTATARVPETVLAGRVRSVSGELAAVETSVGTVRGLHDGLSPEDTVQVRVGADAVTVLAGTEPGADSTSARNRLQGTVTDIVRGETVLTLVITVNDTDFRALVTAESASRLGLECGCTVLLTWKATATRLVGHGE